MIKKRKRRKLKSWVKVAILLLFFTILLSVIFIRSLEEFEEQARQCDLKYGYTCSYYQVRQFIIRGYYEK